jgi:uncharacterized protein DUF927
MTSQTSPLGKPLTPDSVWREVGEIAARNPKVALALGVTFGGMFIVPLDRQPFVLHLAGHARGGKTTALATAAAIFGDPTHLIVSAENMTTTGMNRYLGALDNRPAFIDDLRVGQATEKLIFQATAGNQRHTATRSGEPASSAPWRSTLLTTGEQSILDNLPSEAVAARVLELAAPITENAQDAERLAALTSIPWMSVLDPADADLERVRELVDEAEAELPLPAGGVPRTLGRHLALAVAAATLLVDVTGVTAIRDAVITAARDLLNKVR